MKGEKKNILQRRDKEFHRQAKVKDFTTKSVLQRMLKGILWASKKKPHLEIQKLRRKNLPGKGEHIVKVVNQLIITLVTSLQRQKQ